MTRKTSYLVTSVFFLIGGVCFLITAIINGSKDFSVETPLYAWYLNKYGFYIAAVCMLIAGAGFLHSYFKKVEILEMGGYMKKYEYVHIKISKVFGAESKDHREIIDEYARKGYRYVGFIPTAINDYGKIKEMDLVFEIEHD